MEQTKRLKEVLAIVNDKGGVGKSTTAHNLAAGIINGHPGWRVLIVDLDAQVANVSLLCGWRSVTDRHGTVFEAMTAHTALPVYQVSTKGQDYNGNLYLAPSSEDMLSVEPYLMRELNPLRVLCKVFGRPVMLAPEHGGTQPVTSAFDYIIIDCPPAMNLVTKNAMSVASGIIIPMQLEALPTFGSSSVIRWAEEVRTEINPNLALRGLLKVMVDRRTKASAGFARHIDEEYGAYVFRTEIPRRTKIVEAQAMLQDIYTYAPDCDAARAYADFAQEITSEYND